MSQSAITVAVCTYNRAGLLKRCIDSLLSQTLAPNAYEILVVDNNSSDHTGEVVAEYRHVPNLRAVVEPRPGISAARNRAVAEIATPIIAFLDDDGRAEPDWLERFIARFEELGSDVAIVGGDVDPAWEVPPPPWFSPGITRAASAGLNWSTEARFVDGRWEWLFEGATAYRVAPLREFGGFPESLGRAGDLLISGEAVLHYRLGVAGYRFFYDPAIRMSHLISAERMSKRWVRRRYFWQGVTEFRVNEYLRAHGLQVSENLAIDLPVSEGAWLAAFDDDSSTDFEALLSTMHNLGYLLASQGVIFGR